MVWQVFHLVQHRFVAMNYIADATFGVAGPWHDRDSQRQRHDP